MKRLRSTQGRIGRSLAMALVIVGSSMALHAYATDYPVSGTLGINDQSGPLPDGGVFAGSGYDAESGVIAAGTFVFPIATIGFDSSLGPVVVTYQLGQTNTSNGLVDADGAAALTDTTLQLQVLSAILDGFLPIDVGTCVFAPIDLALAGTATAAGLDLADTGFTIPPVGVDDCGGYGGDIDDGLAGSNNAIAMTMAGDFTPPAAAADTVFVDGFDGI